MGGKTKGNRFEREVCTALSEWWAGRDDVFWRSTTSGARATSRGKRGKDTFGQHGDVAFTHPLGKALLRLVTIELKRGYSQHSPIDLVDRKDSCRQTKMEGFIEQVYNSADAAKTPFWWLIIQRDQHRAMLYMPTRFYIELQETCFRTTPTPSVILHAKVRHGFQNQKQFKFTCCERSMRIIGMPFDMFLRHVGPTSILKIVKKYEARD
jgi:hypothetical protein